MMQRLIISGWTGLLLASSAVAQTAPQTPVLPVEDSDTACWCPPGRIACSPSIPISRAGPTSSRRRHGPGDARPGAHRAERRGQPVARRRQGLCRGTYWSHGNRGTRADVLIIYDGRTLALEREIALPGRLHVVPKSQQAGRHQRGRQARFCVRHVPGADESTSSISRPAPWRRRSISPAARSPFRSAAQFRHDLRRRHRRRGRHSRERQRQGGVQREVLRSRRRSAVREQHCRSHQRRRLVPVLHRQDLPGEAGRKPRKWAAVVRSRQRPGCRCPAPAWDELAWRPGGAQLLALHRATRRLFVLMHPGNHWTHKVDGPRCGCSTPTGTAWSGGSSWPPARAALPSARMARRCCTPCRARPAACTSMTPRPAS